MMSRLLTTKAWQLIVAIVVMPFLLMLVIEVGRHFYYVWQTGGGVPVEENGFSGVFVTAWFTAIFSWPFLWQYQVGTKLTKKLANGRTYLDLTFRIALIIPAVLLTVLILVTIIQETYIDRLTNSELDLQALLFFLVLVTYLIGFYFRYRQMGRTLHWVDEASGNRPRGNAVNLLLSLFWWIGIWFLQPRIRSAWKGMQEHNLEDHFIE